MAQQQAQALIKETFLELAQALETGRLGSRPAIALTGIGSELGEGSALKAALLAQARGTQVHYIGTLSHPSLIHHLADCEDAAHRIMEELLANGTVQGAVTMHYPFPIGVATVGRAIAPATGRPFFLATTTGTAALDRTEALVRGAIAGLITAKACGIQQPSLGLLNIEGARQAEGILRQLQEAGFPLHFGSSGRADGGAILRGNDVLTGSCDVLVSDSLTGNVLCKMLSAFTSGGQVETLGDGYGPGIGEGYERLVLIVSRASGPQVVANALCFAAQLAEGQWQHKAQEQYALAREAGLMDLIKALGERKGSQSSEEIKAPPAEPVTGEIPGIEVMELEDAVALLWKAGIYAKSGMGCTGPIVLVAEDKLSRASQALKQGGFIS